MSNYISLFSWFYIWIRLEENTNDKKENYFGFILQNKIDQYQK